MYVCMQCVNVHVECFKLAFHSVLLCKVLSTVCNGIELDIVLCCSV